VYPSCEKKIVTVVFSGESMCLFWPFYTFT